MNYKDYKNWAIEKKVKVISDLLKQEYLNTTTPLLHKNAYELLIATMLSPQTNDNTTNIVTPILFEKYPSYKDLAKANADDVIKIIRLVNFNKTKAKHIIETAKILGEKYKGVVPRTMEQLIEFPGVGRKVANVVINEWFARLPKDDLEYVDPAGFVIDTHVLRITQRLGLTENSTPEKVEKDMMQIFPMEDWVEMSLRFIFHGREWSQAKNPKMFEHPNKAWHEIYRSMGFEV